MSAPTRQGPVGADRVLEVVWRSCATLAVGWIAYGAWRLVLQPRPEGAIDLRLRWREVRAWFDGVPTYATFSDAVYPPASYLMLRPFAAWDSFTALRWFWLAVSLALLGWLAAQLARAAGEGAWRRPFLAASLACYPIGATLGNGQLGLAVSACLLSLVVRLAAGPRDLRGDLALAGLFLAVLVKPSLGAYFFWTLLFAGGARAAGLVVGSYALLTVWSCSFQEAGTLRLMRAWMRRGVKGAVYGARRGGGGIRSGAASPDGTVELLNVNLHSLFGAMRWMEHLFLATLIVLGLLGLWTWWRRRSSVWNLVAVAALVSLLSAYHGWYDHILLLLPLIALHRIAQGAGRSARTARVLFVALALSILAPGGIYLLPQPWKNLYVIAQSVVWGVTLVFLLRVAGAESRAARGPADHQVESGLGDGVAARP